VSIFADFRAETRPYSGYADPSLPIGSYIGSAVVQGDATGGSVFFTMLVQIAETTRVTELYNLEQLAIEVSSAVSVSAFVRTINMDTLAPNNRFAQIQRWFLPITTDGVGIAAMNLADAGGLPLWLGAPSSIGGDAGLRFQFVNVDGDNFLVTAQGYIWGPRSVIAPGGPQRPPFGYFGP